MTGFEPVTSSLPRKHSTPELHRLVSSRSIKALQIILWGEQDSNLRRCNQQIYSLPSLAA